MLRVFLEEEFHVVKRFADKKQHIRAAFCKEERGELRRFSRKIRYVETPYWAVVTMRYINLHLLLPLPPLKARDKDIAI